MFSSCPGLEETNSPMYKYITRERKGGWEGRRKKRRVSGSKSRREKEKREERERERKRGKREKGKEKDREGGKERKGERKLTCIEHLNTLDLFILKR